MTIHELGLCGLAFARELDQDPGLWAIRNPLAGVLWRNRAWRRHGVVAEPRAACVPWIDAQNTIFLDDLARAEDHTSRALKLNRPEAFVARFKIHPPALTWFRVWLWPVDCRACGRAHCGLVLIQLEPFAP